MMYKNQYDLSDEEIDENVTIQFLPISMPQTLKNSRVNLQQYHINQVSNINQSLIDQIRQRKQVRNKQNLNNSNTYNGKNFQKFLENQKAYQRRIQQKLQRLREQKQNNIPSSTFIPQINKKSKQYVKNTKESVFKRLYIHVKNQDQGKIIESYTPKISQNKRIPRKQVQKEKISKDLQIRSQISQPKINQQNKTSPKQQSFKLNRKNEKLIIKKFLQQYIQILEHVQLHEQTFNKQAYLQILYCLGFITKVSTTQFQLNKINQLFIQFGKYPNNYINFFTFLLTLIGIYQFNPFQYMLIDGKWQQKQQIVKISQNQAKNLHKKFNSLYRNRLCYQQKQIKTKQSYSFKPSISKQSEHLAKKHRKQTLKNAKKYNKDMDIDKNAILSHPDYLLLKNYIKQLQIQQLRQQNEQKNMKQCTFVPKISNFVLKDKHKSVINDLQNNKNVNTKANKDMDVNRMLVLQVNFGGIDEQIILAQQDRNRLDQVVKVYVDKYSMNEQSQADLYNMLSSQLNSIFQ